MIYYHITTASKVKYILKQGLIPQVGERSAKIGEEAGVFLFSTYEDCQNALLNWLGEELNETAPNEEIITLKVELPDDFPLEESVEYERISRKVIPPNYIRFFKNE